tara:strand:+ start:2035 stop:3216 length:1182 start_codon:yes stop_codon:yes gene_type:complete
MENSKEIAENKLRIERFDRLIASSKSALIELEHEMAEIEVETTDLIMDIEKNRHSIKDEIKKLNSELKSITEEQPEDLEEKSLDIKNKIDLHEGALRELKDCEKQVLILKKRREQLVNKINKEKENNEYLSSKKEKLLKINFELLDNPSHQIKVTLNYEENLILEELVKKEGSNKSSVIRNMIKDFSNATKERDALGLKLEKFVSERRLEYQMLEREKINQLEILKNKMELEKKDFELKFSEGQHKSSSLIETLKATLAEKGSTIENLKNALKDEKEKPAKILSGLTGDNEEKFISVYLKPKKFDDLHSIINFLKEKKGVVINLQNLEKNDRNRFTDLIFGVVAGIGGEMKKIGDEILFLSSENHKLLENIDINEEKKIDKETDNYLKGIDSN